MIRFELLKDEGVLMVGPVSALSADDFLAVASAVDPYILEKGKLTGLLVEAPTFPGWESFGGLIEHMRFVRDHHRKIDRIAIVTDDTMLTIAPKIAEHFVHPEIKLYKSGEKAGALAWLTGRV